MASCQALHPCALPKQGYFHPCQDRVNTKSSRQFSWCISELMQECDCILEHCSVPAICSICLGTFLSRVYAGTPGFIHHNLKQHHITSQHQNAQLCKFRPLSRIVSSAPWSPPHSSRVCFPASKAFHNCQHRVRWPTLGKRIRSNSKKIHITVCIRFMAMVSERSVPNC